MIVSRRQVMDTDEETVVGRLELDVLRPLLVPKQKPLQVKRRRLHLRRDRSKRTTFLRGSMYMKGKIGQT